MRSLTRFLLIFVFILILVWSCSPFKSELIFADVNTNWWHAPTIIATNNEIIKDLDNNNQKNFFEKNDLRVNVFNVNSGLASKNAVLSGSADIGIVASTPLALGAYDQEKLIVLCSFVNSNSLLGIIAGANSQEKNGAIIPQPPIAIVPGTISQFYLYNYGKEYGITEELKGLSKLDLKPPNISNAIQNGNAKSASIWEPYLSLIQENLDNKNEKYTLIRKDNLYNIRLYLVTRPEILKIKKEAIKKFILAVQESCQFINENRSSVKIALEKHFGYSRNFLNQVWEQVDFEVSFDYDQMKQLILEDANLAYQLKLGKAKTMLDMKSLNYYFDENFRQEISQQS